MKAQPNLNYLEQGIKSFERNDLKKALSSFLKHLNAHPNDAIANKAVGSIYFNQKQYEKALHYLEVANQNAPDDVEVLNLLGASNMELLQFIEAHEYFNAAIERKPDYIDGIFNIGLLYFQTKNYSTGINAFKHLLDIDSSHTMANIYLGLSFECLEEFEQATDTLFPLLRSGNQDVRIIFCLIRCCAQLKKLDEIDELINLCKDPVTLFNVANYFLEVELSDKSLAIYQKIKPVYPDTAAILNNMASAYDNLDQADKAIETYKLCINEFPDHIAAYSNLGRVLCDVNKTDEAIDYIEKGLTLNPNHSNSYINLGRAYEIRNDLDVAYRYYLKAFEISPDDDSALYNIGNIHLQRSEYSQAIDFYQKCLAINPNHNDAQFNLGIAQLTTGNFADGWGHYFQRMRHLKDDESLTPITPGLNYKDKKVYLRWNQGLGDELLFLRFLPQLKKQGAEIIYRCQNKLYDLLKGNPYIDHLINDDEPKPTADYYYSIDDLPLVLGMHSMEQIPQPFPLNNAIPKNANPLQEKFKSLPRPFIGITWRAGTTQVKTNFKSKLNKLKKEFSLDTMIEILKGFSGSVFVLQRKPDSEEIEKLKSIYGDRLVDTSEYNEDLIQMAQLLDLLDDSICVSNTNVHILAGLNKTCKVLVPSPPEWRWMNTSGKSPWFANMETFRQSADGDWSDAIQGLKHKISSNNEK